MSPIKTILAEKRVLLVLGPGGVGKTTSSIALALLGAKMGKKVGLLSIDPAKRLAVAMGLHFGSRLHKVDLQDGGQGKGELYACMLDQASVFDSMVTKFSSEKMAKAIFKNPIYQQASRNLGGPLEYMAMAKLSQLVEDEAFDLIVVDTPPDSHAIDFLVKPHILSGFVETGVMKWLIKPFYLAGKLGMGRILSFGEKLMGGVAEVTGVKMLERFSEFLVQMDGVIQGFHQSSDFVARKLREKETGFLVALSAFPSSFRSGKNLQKELFAAGFPLDGFLLNRVLPAWQQEALKEYVALKDGKKLKANPVFDKLWEKSAITQKEAGSLQVEYRSLFGKDAVLLGIPEIEDFSHSLSGMEVFCDLLEKAGPYGPGPGPGPGPSGR